MVTIYRIVDVPRIFFFYVPFGRLMLLRAVMNLE